MDLIMNDGECERHLPVNFVWFENSMCMCAICKKSLSSGNFPPEDSTDINFNPFRNFVEGNMSCAVREVIKIMNDSIFPFVEKTVPWLTFEELRAALSEFCKEKETIEDFIQPTRGSYTLTPLYVEVKSNKN